MSIDRIPDRTEASDLPKIAPNWGDRTAHSAEAKAVGSMPIDKEDLQRAKKIDQTEKSMTFEDPDTGKIYTISPDQYKSIMEAA